MLVIYDLDKTSLYCPIADFMDKFIPKNKALKKLYYNLYPFVHIFEKHFGLLKINDNIYNRAKVYSEMPDVRQVVITARHNSMSLPIHVEAVFHELKIPYIAIAQGITNINKVEVLKRLPINAGEEIVMFDDNLEELNKVHNKYSPKFTGVRVEFLGKKEEIKQYVH